MEAFGGGTIWKCHIGFTILLWVQQEYSGLSGMKWKETVDVSAGDVVERFGLFEKAWGKGCISVCVCKCVEAHTYRVYSRQYDLVIYVEGYMTDIWWQKKKTNPYLPTK